MNSKFVIFDIDTGNIRKITSQQPLNDNFVEVDVEDVRPILSCIEPPINFLVEYDYIQKKNIFKPRSDFNVHELDINDLIYQIPEICKQDIIPDITVLQSYKESCWKVLISSELETSLKERKISLRNDIDFSITEYNNPNILHRSFSVNLERLVKQHYYIEPFIDSIEFTNIELSVFTTKRFNSYLFKRIKDE